MLTHLLTDDLVVETQIAGGGSADLSSSICARKGKRLNDPVTHPFIFSILWLNIS